MSVRFKPFPASPSQGRGDTTPVIGENLPESVSPPLIKIGKLWLKIVAPG